MMDMLQRPEKVDSKEALMRSLAHLSETSSTFESKDVLRFMLAEGMGNFRFDAAKDQIDAAIHEGWLNQSEDKSLLYTPQTLEREITTLALEKNGRSAVNPILPRKLVQKTFDGHELTKGQVRASKLILTSPNLSLIHI